MWGLGWVTIALAALTACSDDRPEATQLVVVIDAETVVRARATNLRITIQSSPDRTLSELRDADTYLVQPGVDGEADFPLSVSMAPGAGRLNWFVVVTATALEGTQELASARMIAQYVRGEVKYAWLLLETRCIGQLACTSIQTCRDGTCDDAYVPADALFDDRPQRPDGGDATCAGACGDGLYCNGEEYCDPTDPAADEAGCVSPGRVCDDGIACTTDSCSNNERRCVHVPPDADNDGHADVRCLDGVGEPLGDDCDDDDPDRFPGNPEICDDIDQDCDPTTIGFKDSDGDGSIDAACCNTDDTGAERCGLDCDDDDLAVHGRQPEFCDGKDNDCDDMIDEVDNQVAWFVDGDGDGFGAGDDALRSCTPISGRSLLNTDCDDADNGIHPASAEQCDGVDNDCDGTIDEGLANCVTAPTVPPAPRINECVNGLDDCDAIAVCVDRPVGFECVCGDRYEGDGHGEGGCACGKDVDETCDDVDDDCDDVIDEDYVATACDDDDAAWLMTCEAGVEVCRCVASSSLDVPGDGADVNCDGFDGDLAGSIFVSPGGAVLCESPAGDTPAEPCADLQAAVDRAAVEGKVVIAAVGMYASDDALMLANGVSIYGGFDLATGRRATSGTTIIEAGGSGTGHSVVVAGSGITSLTRISNVQLEALRPQSPGMGAYGLICNGCSGLRLDDVNIVVGAGAAGVAGSKLADGRPGGRGSNGAFADSPTAAGGGGGTGYPNRGGNGGGGGPCVVADLADRFFVGGPGQLPPPNGGGSGASATLNAVGGSGAHGAGGGPTQDPDNGAAAWCEVAPGVDGWCHRGATLTGSDGQPGSGGGGGYGRCDYKLDPEYWGGGGGGGGGEAGRGGPGGGPGGPSIGVILRNSAGANLTGVRIQVGAGGLGGDGAPGSEGGVGGSFGTRSGGAAPVQRGGVGGRGGGGGGGEGGPGGASVNLVLDVATSLALANALPTITRTTVPVPAAGGAGGPGGSTTSSIVASRGASGLQGPDGVACDVVQVGGAGDGTCL